MVLSRKVVAQIVTNVLMFGVAYLVSKFGIHETAQTAELVSSVVGVASGALAGYIVKEIPDL